MKNRLRKILFIAFIAVGIVAISLISAGTILGDQQSSKAYSKYRDMDNKFQAIGTVYQSLGAGSETQKTLDDFFGAIPSSLNIKSNIVITDKSGHILLKANNDFIHTESSDLTMAWNGYGVILDQSLGTKYWVNITEENISEYEYGTVRMIGAERIKQSQDELRSMISAYGNINGSESEVEIASIGDRDDKDPLYLFWFRNLGAGEAISRSFGTYNYQIYTYVTSAGLVLLLLYWLLAPVWVFLDARKRQIQPLPWALLVLLTNIMGLIVYWIAQTQNIRVNPALVCPACGNAVHKNHLYCPWCATPLVKACESCGKTLEKDWIACPWCGTNTEQTSDSTENARETFV